MGKLVGNKMKKIIIIVFTFIIILNLNSTYAHSGRTDGSGGHKDKNNVSGLGYYHYHHGDGPHLHPNGVCPYDKSKEALPVSSQYNTQSIYNKSEKQEETNYDWLFYIIIASIFIVPSVISYFEQNKKK